MSHKLKHSMAALLAVILVVSLLPLGSLVRADAEQEIYYLYEFDEVQADGSISGVAKEVPYNACQIGVFVNGGSYEYEEGDGFVMANNATIYAEADDYFDLFTYYLAGDARISTEYYDIYSNNPAYNGDIDFYDIYDYFKGLYEGNTLEFKSDYLFNSSEIYYLDEFDAVIVPEDITVTLGPCERHGKVRSSTIYVNNLEINGTFVIEGVTEGVSGLNEVDIESGGSLVFGDNAELIGGHGACIYPFSNVTFTNFTIYDYDYVNETLTALPDDETDRVVYDEEIGQWITSDVLVLSNWFSANYKDFERGRLLTANDYRVGDDEFYPFEVGSEIEFTLNLPQERLGETPVVTLVYDNDLGSIPVKLTKVSESEYTFSYTPENKYGFSVWINWSDFDTTVYDDEHFYVELDCKGSLEFDISPEGEVLQEPNNPNHVRVRYENEAINDGITITVSPLSGHSIQEIRYDWQYIDLWDLSDIDGLTFENGVLVINLNKKNYDPRSNDFEVLADDAINNSNNEPKENEIVIDADIWEIDGEQQAEIVFSNNEFENLWINEYLSKYEFDIGEELTFELIPPEERQIDGLVPIVNITQGDNSWSSLLNTVELIETEEFVFEFTFVPESSEGIYVEIFWSIFDKFEPGKGDIMIDIDCSNEYEKYEAMAAPDSVIREPGNVSHKKLIYSLQDLESDYIGIKLDPGNDVTVKEVVIECGNSKQSYVRNDISIDELSGKLHFSDLSWFSEDDDGTTILYVPADISENIVKINIYYVGDSGPDVKTSYYQIDYAQSWDSNFDPLDYVEVNGKLVDANKNEDFEVGKELVFTIHAPEDRAGLQRYVSIYNDDYSYYYSSTLTGDQAIEITDDTFTFTPPDDSPFTVEIYWCEFDSIYPNREQIMIETTAYGDGEITVSDTDRKVVDPADSNTIKNLVSKSVLYNDGTIDISFIPDEGASLVSVNIMIGGMYSVTYVPEWSEWYQDANLFSEDPHFELVDGIWTYKINKAQLDEDTYDITANFEIPEEPEVGNITVNSGDVSVQYALVKDGVTGNYVDLDGTIKLEPDDIADKVILKFAAPVGVTLPPLKITRSIMGAILNPKIVRVNEDNTIVLEKGDWSWGTWTVGFADGGEILPYEFMIEVVGTSDYDPLINYDAQVKYSYGEDDIIELDLGEDTPYKVVVYPHSGEKIVLTKASDGKYYYAPEMLEGFIIFIYENQNAYEYDTVSAGEDELQFIYAVDYCDYPESVEPSSKVDLKTPANRVVYSANESTVKVIISDEVDVFTLKIVKGDEAGSYKVLMDGRDITELVIKDDDELSLSKEVIEDGVDLNVTFYYAKTYAVTCEETENGQISAVPSAKPGDLVTIEAIPEKGYELDTITVKDSDGIQIDVTDNSFTMPDSDVTVAATFRKAEPAKNGWVLENGKYYYYDNGTMKTGWIQSGSFWYYMNPSDGTMVTGWQSIGGKWYYFEGSGSMSTGWKSIGGVWYYFGTSGAMMTGWQEIGGRWYYFDNSGAMATGWKQSGGKWYLFDSSGVMLTGWNQEGSIWYFFDDNGAMVTGWKSSGGKWYYFEGSGAMATGWKQLGGVWYYFGTSGAMATGWQSIGGKWYYFEGSGAMVSGWKQLGGKWYYFYGGGAMASNTVIDGCTLGSDGAWTGK